MEFEFTVHFQKGSRVGARSLRMETVYAVNARVAVTLAMESFPDFRAQGYRIVRVDHFENGRLVLDR